MCLGVPARIEETYEKDGLKMARVDFGGVSREVCLDYVPEARVGDYCIIHVGFAISLLQSFVLQNRINQSFRWVIAGTLGSWIGATAMYWLARLAGRPLFMRYGKFILITPQKIEGAERWAVHYGSMGIFISRLLPVVRHLIGIPAGVVRMNYRAFSLYTLLGSAIWCSVLCYVGIKMGQDEKLMAGQLHRISLWLGGAVLVLGGLYYFFVHRQMKQGRETEK